MRTRTRGFALTDLCAALVTGGVLACLVLAFLSDSRRHAQLGEDIASLKRYGAATTMYGADHEDQLWGFTWRGGETYLMMDLDGDLVPTQMPSDDIGAGAYQAVHLIRLIGGRIGPMGMPTNTGWLPHTLYSHLPLLEYLDEDPLVRWTASAADRVRQHWKDDPINKFDKGFWLPLQPDPGPLSRRWPYSTGFDIVSASWDFGQSELGDEWNGKRVQQSVQHYTYSIPDGVQVSGRLLSDVSFPGGKVHMHDAHQRHFGERVYFFGVFEGGVAGSALARVPVLTFDASAGVRNVDDCNPGWRPNVPTFPCLAYWYTPNDWEPATTNGEFQQLSGGYMRWTRGGLKGLDFGGLPLDTGQTEPGECSL